MSSDYLKKTLLSVVVLDDLEVVDAEIVDESENL